MNFWYAIISSIVVSLISLVGIFSLVINEKLLPKIIFVLISFAAGSLIGASFLHILPETVEYNKETTFYYVILGFLLFFILEKYFHWRHCHKGANCEIHPIGYLNILGDSIHNFTDGVFIGVSFYVDFRVGLISTLAVILHEIPQELGDFGILLHSGFTKTKAIILNFLTALFCVLGTILGYSLSEYIKNLSLYVLPILAGGFIYISSCDLIPEIHREKDIKNSLVSIIFFVLGILFMAIFKIH